MLYNGVELPSINTVWADKSTYPYVGIFVTGNITFFMGCTGPLYCVAYTDGSNNCIYVTKGSSYFYYRLTDGAWTNYSSGSDSRGDGYWGTGYDTHYVWANHDITNFSGSTTFLSASDPVDPNAPVESPIMDVLSTTADSSSINADFNVSGISSDSLYTITASCFFGEYVVGSSAVGPYSGPEFQTTVSVDGLSPSTEYTVEYQLSKDGEYTGV